MKKWIIPFAAVYVIAVHDGIPVFEELPPQEVTIAVPPEEQAAVDESPNPEPNCVGECAEPEPDVVPEAH